MIDTLRILHVLSHDRIKSGGAFQALLLARAQRRRGHDVRILYNSGDDPTAAAAAFAGLRDEGFACSGIPMQRMRQWLGRRRLAQHLRDVDVIHAHRERALRLVASSIRRDPRPVLIAQKGNCYRSDDPTRMALQSSRVDRIVAVAEAVKRVLVVHDEVSPSKVEVVYGSFDQNRFAQAIDRGVARRELGLPPTAPIVGILANLDRKKGHDRFFRVARRILDRRPDALFAVVGDGDLARARQMASGCGVLATTRFLGFHPAVERVIPALDVSVNISHDGEGLTGALRESLALGCPVVCTNIGGNSELVENNVTGILVAPQDDPSFAAGVLRLLDDPQLAQRLAATGKQRVWDWMHDDVRCERVLAIYSDALAWRRLQASRPDRRGLVAKVPLFVAPPERRSMAP